MSYQFVSETKDRHGKLRHRFRAFGRDCYLPGSPGDPGFDEAYHMAIHGSPLEDVVRARGIERNIKAALKRAKTRAARAKVPFDLSEDVFAAMLDEQNYRCSVSGIPFHMFDRAPSRQKHAFRPSLDRIIPANGYVKSNVRLVCEIVNLAMNNWGEEPLRILVRQWRFLRSVQPDCPTTHVQPVSKAL